MKRVLFVTVPERGHYHVLIGPAQILVEEGHAVAFFAARDLSLELAAAGLPAVHCFGRAESREDNRGRALAELLSDARRLRAWIRELLLGGVEQQLAELDAAIADFEPDVVACDPMVYAAPIAALRARLPWIALSASLNPVLPRELDSELLSTVRELASERAGLFAAHGASVCFSGCDALSPHGNLVFASAALVGAAPIGVELVGPSRPRGRGDDEEPITRGPPLVYASLGSQNWHQPTWIARVLDAVRGRPVRLLLSAGGLAATTPDVPENATIVPYTDQRAALREARVFITHGGANSVIEGLDAGVPLLMTPLVNDQPHNAWFVERAGAGRTLDLQHASPDELWAHLEALLAEGPERRAAATIAESLRALDGARTAATRIVTVRA